MNATDQAEGGRAEPIDVDFEPAERPVRARPRRRAGVGAGTALGLSVLAAAAGAAGGALAPRVPEISAALDQVAPPPAAPAATDIAAQGPAAAALEARLAQIETFVGSVTAETASEGGLAPVGAQVIAMQAALSAVEGRLEALPSSEQITELTGAVEGVRAALPDLTTRIETAENAARSAVAVAAAADAARASGAFQESYAALAALLPNDPNVAALAPLAQVGAPTRVELRDRFAALELSVVRAAAQSQAAAGLWGRAQAAAATWITVRRRGEGETPAGIVERAGERLRADDLAGALAELDRLAGPPAQVLAPWMAQARQRLEIDTRLAAIRAELSRRG